ncbi:MAG: DUF4330 domain-containing protein [Defluviitaleaceae bacterium]|nr:DUF4330 domain-containing protein [Defluviitaleaceae bacterium]
MDRKFRLFGKISILDIILVILLVIFVVLAYQFSAPQTVSAKAGDKQITYVVEIQKRKLDFADQIKVGAKLYDSIKGYYIGDITDVSTKPYTEDTYDTVDGKIVRPDIPGYYFIYVTVQAQAQVTDKDTLVGQYEVLVGETVYVKNADFAAGGYVVAMSGVRG